MTEPTLVWRQCVCDAWYWGAAQTDADKAHSRIEAEAAAGPRDEGLRESIDAVADALNAWDMGEDPRPDTHRHWSRILAALAKASE